MLLKKVVRKAYQMMLAKKWNMGIGGASLLTDVFYHDYRKHMSHAPEVYSIHRKGFSWDDWYVNDLDKNDYTEYLKTAQYYAMHPLNGNFSHWIDDKLTLKYLCAGTVLDKYMPEYYYQIDKNGNIQKLPDGPDFCSGGGSQSFLKIKESLHLNVLLAHLEKGFIRLLIKRVCFI